MAICPIHGVDHDLEDDSNSESLEAKLSEPEVKEKLTAMDKRIHRMVDSFPLDRVVIDASTNTTVHFLPDSRVTDEMRENILWTIRQIDSEFPHNHADVFFPVPGSSLLELHPDLLATKDSRGRDVPREMVERAMAKTQNALTYRTLIFNSAGDIDPDRTLTSSNRFLFIPEGLINADRKDPYDYEEDSQTVILRALAAGMGRDSEKELPKRSEKMYLAWSIFAPLIYNLVHEMGHVVDSRNRHLQQEVIRQLTEQQETNPKKFEQFMRDLSHWAFQGGESETYAEAFVEWVATNGDTPNEVSKTYAELFQWPVFPDWDFPHDVRDFANEPVINSDEFVADNNPFA